MQPRYGRLYGAAVLRPLAEQLLAILGVRAGETVCDLVCDGGVLTRMLADAAGPRGSVIAVDVAESLVESARAAGGARSAPVRTIITDGSHVALPSACCDHVASVLTIGFGDAAALRVEAHRVARSTGSVAAVCWDPSRPPPHERALAAALHEAGVATSPFLATALSSPWHVSPGSQRRDVHDVVRFDGFASYWTACVSERPLGIDIASLPDEQLDIAKTRCLRELEAFIAADGTMRIPVDALVLS